MKSMTKSMKSKTAKRGAPVVLGVIALVALSACGSSSKASVSPGAQPSAIAAPTTAPATSTSAKTVVKTGTSPKLGAVLTDSNGMTLYTLTNAGAPVACTGQCLTVWPPLYLPAGTTTPTATAGVTGLSVSMQMGGTQVTQNGDPLYRFAHDTAPGDTNGEGIMAFGGVWHAAKTTSSTAAATTPATAAPVTTPTTAASTGGYGY